MTEKNGKQVALGCLLMIVIAVAGGFLATAILSSGGDKGDPSPQVSESTVAPVTAEPFLPEPESSEPVRDEGSPTQGATSEEPVSVHYGSCKEVRNAGVAPIREGDPGYNGDLDRDGDGVACES